MHPEPLVRPPRLRTGEKATASRLELFFDLAYVLVILQLSSTFAADLSWHGLVVFAGLFIAMWFSWVGFTLYANRFDTDDVVFRIAKLAATLSVAGCAASAATITADAESQAVPFAICYSLNRVVLVLLYLRAWRHVPEARPVISVYLATTGASALVWAASIPIPGNARFGLWAVAVVVSAAGPLLTRLREETVALHAEHLPERFALLVILVLGEAVSGAVSGVADASWAATSIAVGAAGFALAAAMWWIYFDVTADRSAGELEEAQDHAAEPEVPHTDERHEFFVYGHLPLTLGIVLTGVGIKEIGGHPEVAQPSAGSWLLAGGVVLFLLGAAAVLGGTSRNWRTAWPWPVLAAPLATVAACVPYPGGLAGVTVLAVMLIGAAGLGTRQSRRLVR